MTFEIVLHWIWRNWAILIWWKWLLKIMEYQSEQIKTVPSEYSRMTIKQIVTEWKKHGIVSETDSPYASPVLLVTKKTWEPRFVIDYRKLNKQTGKKNFPIANPDEYLDIVSGCSLFIVLDLAHGYLQLPNQRRKQPLLDLTKWGNLNGWFLDSPIGHTNFVGSWHWP